MVRILLTVVVSALFLAVPAAAVPECTDTAPHTRTCVTPGHTAIVTSPNPTLTSPFPAWGFGWGTPLIGLGGGGIWIGI